MGGQCDAQKIKHHMLLECRGIAAAIQECSRPMEVTTGYCSLMETNNGYDTVLLPKE